jgi:hypothetical protein
MLFLKRYTFINGTDESFVRISAFVIWALAAKTSNYFSGLTRSGLQESVSRTIQTNFNPVSFLGLMEFVNTGALEAFLKGNKKNTSALNNLWQLADSLLLVDMQEILKPHVVIAPSGAVASKSRGRS